MKFVDRHLRDNYIGDNESTSVEQVIAYYNELWQQNGVNVEVLEAADLVNHVKVIGVSETDYPTINKIFDGIVADNDIEWLFGAGDIFYGVDNLEDMFNELPGDWYDITGETIVPFDEDVINDLFSSPSEAMRALYFGDVDSWYSDYIRINSAGNIESIDNYPFDDYEHEIVTAYYDEKSY